MKIGWNKLNDREKFLYLCGELQNRGTLTLEEWEHYNRLFKQIDPEGYAADQAAAHKRNAIRNAKNSLTIAELYQIIEDKRTGPL